MAAQLPSAHQYPPSSSSTRDHIPWVLSIPCLPVAESTQMLSAHAVGLFKENSALKSQQPKLTGRGHRLTPEEPSLIAEYCRNMAPRGVSPKYLRSPLQVHFPPGPTSTRAASSKGASDNTKVVGLQALSNAWAWSSDPHPSAPLRRRGRAGTLPGLKAISILSCWQEQESMLS